MQLLIGDWISRVVATAQPIKLAAIEGLCKTTKGAPEHLLGWYTEGQVKYGIAIPNLLSLLAFHNPNADVKGLDTVPADRRPPVNVVRVSFQTMVGIGTLLALLAVVYLFVWITAQAPAGVVWFYRALALAGPASVVALIAGWVTTEVGRQPWVVYKVMLTSEAVTGAGGIPVGYGTLAAGLRLRRARRRLGPAPARAHADGLAQLGRARGRAARATRAEPGGLSVHLYDDPADLRARSALVLYAVLAGADFGAGFWQLFAGRGRARRAGA